MFYCNRPFHDFCQLLNAAEFYRRLYGGGGGGKLVPPPTVQTYVKLRDLVEQYLSSPLTYHL